MNHQVFLNGHPRSHPWNVLKGQPPFKYAYMDPPVSVECLEATELLSLAIYLGRPSTT